MILQLLLGSLCHYKELIIIYAFFLNSWDNVAIASFAFIIISSCFLSHYFLVLDAVQTILNPWKEFQNLLP